VFDLQSNGSILSRDPASSVIWPDLSWFWAQVSRTSWIEKISLDCTRGCSQIVVMHTCIFQARTCNTLSFRAVARSATHRYRVSPPAPWPRARTGARTATLPWRGGRGAGKGVPPPPPQRRPPAGLVQRLRAGPSPRRAPARGRHGAQAGGWDAPPRDGAPLAASVDGVSNRRRAAATEAGAQARSSAGHRGPFEPRKSVAARNLGR